MTVHAHNSGLAFTAWQSVPTDPGGLSSRAIWPDDWLWDVADELNKLLELPPNWDSYGSRAISSLSVVNAQRLARGLAEAHRVLRPQVSASADGHAVLCWYDEGFSLEMEVTEAGAVEFVRMRGEDGEEGITHNADFLISLAESSASES